jgi:hypothetical protein
MPSHVDPRQAALAEFDLAAWLAYPTELGVKPDEMELLRTVEVDTPDGPCDLFVFRFRTHEPQWAAGSGWMIGVAGPYLRSGPPTTRGLGYTFSRLAREDAMTIDEHVKQLIGPVGEFMSKAPSKPRSGDTKGQ